MFKILFPDIYITQADMFWVYICVQCSHVDLLHQITTILYLFYRSHSDQYRG